MNTDEQMKLFWKMISDLVSAAYAEGAGTLAAHLRDHGVIRLDIRKAFLASESKVALAKVIAGPPGGWMEPVEVSYQDAPKPS